MVFGSFIRPWMWGKLDMGSFPWIQNHVIDAFVKKWKQMESFLDVEINIWICIIMCFFFCYLSLLNMSVANIYIELDIIDNKIEKKHYFFKT
jgi:hypothetical protein